MQTNWIKRRSKVLKQNLPKQFETNFIYSWEIVVLCVVKPACIGIATLKLDQFGLCIKTLHDWAAHAWSLHSSLVVV